MSAVAQPVSRPCPTTVPRLPAADLALAAGFAGTEDFPLAPMTDAECVALDMAMHRDKLADGWNQRNDARAMKLQLQHADGSYL